MAPTAALLCALALLASRPVLAESTEARQAAVAERGSETMTFDLDATRHHFVRTPDGGTQRVVALDAGDSANAAAIRTHLAQIAVAFRARDFSSPKRIHGDAMPGLAALERALPESLSIEYVEIDAGAELRYASRDPEIVAALHAWFDAQLADHGHHATPR